MMDLSQAEETIIGLLRGGAEIDFTMNVAWLGGTWTVCLSDGSGAVAGAGETFGAALYTAMDVKGGPAGGGEPIPVRPSLSVVGGTA